MDCAIKNNLTECLAAKGINQSQLARRFHLSRAHVSRLVRGTVLPSLGLALRLAKYFGKPVDSIFVLAETSRQTISHPPSVVVGTQQPNKTETMKGKRKCS
jgi:putative transcriptional regulator